MRNALYIFLFLSLSCATIKTPGGGDKDEHPPIIKEMFPANFSTNFKGNKVVLNFDEYIKLQNIYEQLLVSPPLEERPEIIVKGKTLILEFAEELRENTTYTLNFGEGVVDNNEGNILDSNKVVFSTGNILDSLSVRGMVSLANNARPFSSGVLLHSSLEDSVINSKSPSYFTKSDENGYFEFENLAQGEYQIFGLEDLNRNYQWDENERLAFLKESIIVTASDTNLYDLRLFKKTPEELEIKDSQVQNTGQLDLVFNKAIDKLTFEEIGFVFDTIYREYFSDDSLRVWYTGIQPKEDCFLVIRNNEDIVDTLSLFVFESKKERKYPEFKIQNDRRIDQDPRRKLTMIFSNPIEAVNPEHITFIIDTLKREVSFDQIGPLELQAEIDWGDERQGSIGLFPGAIKDIYGQMNDTTITAIKVLSENDFGEFNLNIKLPFDGDFSLHVLIDKKREISEALTKDTLFNWTGLKPGKIELLLIHDLNKNGEWDSGDYYDKKLPEKTWSFGQEVQLRSNWTLDQDWIVIED